MVDEQFSENNDDLVQVVLARLQAEWPALAAMAWQAYQTYGRGAVVVDFRGRDIGTDDLPLGGYAQLAKIAPEVKALHELVTQYDPAQSLVAVVYSPTADTMIFGLEPPPGQPKPPHARLDN